MRNDYKKKAIDAIKRFDGLSIKLRNMIDADEYCPEILQLILAMQGHLKNIQGHVLESHLHTCAAKKLRSDTEQDAFIHELVKVIGLSKR